MTRFDLLYILALPILAPYLLWRRWRHGKYSNSAGGMMGRDLPRGSELALFAQGTLWVHAVSVGEVAAARAVVPGLEKLEAVRQGKGELPVQVVVSTITETGQAAAARAFPDAAITYFPLDFSINVKRFLAAFRPRVFVLLETELWPNFLIHCAASGVPCFMINGRLSDRSFPRYKKFRGVLAPALRALRGVCVQTPLDAERFEALGVPRERIAVTGNCKFDIEQQPLSKEERGRMFAAWGMNPRRRWIVAGSTHPGEEALMLRAFGEVREAHPDAGLVLCPRHPERFAEARRLAAASGLRSGAASAPALEPNGEDAGEVGEDGDPEVVVLDLMGVLAKAYGLGEIAIVAGSFCPVGGHNLLEAAAHGVPVIYGPDMHSQRELARLFNEARAGLQVDEPVPATTINALMSDDAKRKSEGARCLEVVEKNRGNAAKAIAAIEGWLK